jgi:hypothetical protein
VNRVISVSATVLLPLLAVAAGPAGSAAPPPPPPPPVDAPDLSGSEAADADWSLVLDDEFDGDELNTALWRPGWFGSDLIGPVNPAETQGYDAQNVSVSGGRLRLRLTAQHGALVSANLH